MARGFAKDYGFPAEMFVTSGINYAVLDFVAVMEAAGGLWTMVDQKRRAVIWLHDHAAELGGDPERLFVAGHSSAAPCRGVADDRLGGRVRSARGPDQRRDEHQWHV